MWALAWTPRLGRRLGPALTTRRLRRDPDPGSVIRVMVAAAVLLAVTLTGGRTAADWRDDAGRLRAGGPVTLAFDQGALRAYAAARDADPQGKWLMAAVAINDLDPAARRVFVDSSRWDAVVGDFVSGTSVAGAGAHMKTLADQDGPPLMKADTIQADVSSIRAGDTGRVSVGYLSDNGYAQVAHLKVDHAGTVTGRLAACTVGCAVLSINLSGAPFDVSSVSAGDTQLLGSTSYAGGPVQHALTVDAGEDPAAALATSGLDHANDVRRHRWQGATPVTMVGVVGAVPFVGRAGSLLDLGRVLRGSVGTVASARSVVIARADTPASVIAQLRKDGGGKPSTYAAVAGELDATPSARADSLALLVAVGVGLVALTHLLAWLAGQLGRRRAEVAGLRAAGIGPRRGASRVPRRGRPPRRVVLVTATVAAVITTVPLLKPIRLVGGWATGPRSSISRSTR